MEELASQATAVRVLLPAVLWIAFWLLAVDWRKVWPVLRIGGWAPVVLLLLVGAGVWSRVAPDPCTCLKAVTIPNGWWQLGAVASLAATALFCGWLQGTMGWTPTEHATEPPESEDHGHAAAHGHH